LPTICGRSSAVTAIRWRGRRIWIGSRNARCASSRLCADRDLQSLTEFVSQRTATGDDRLAGIRQDDSRGRAGRRDAAAYDPEKLPLSAHDFPPRDAPAGTVNPGMVANFHDFPPPAGQDAAFKRRYLQAYRASISYMDACVGRVLAALEAAGLRDNTLVVFAGDHGYLMGEHGSWGHKHSNSVPPATAAPPGRDGLSLIK